MPVKTLLIFLLLVLALVGCEAGIAVVTPTPGEVVATPTQETWEPTPMPGWGVWCLDPGQSEQVYNVNPCLSGVIVEQHHGASQARPLQYDLAFLTNQSGEYDEFEIWHDDGFVVDLTYKQGGVGYEIPLIQPAESTCNLLIIDGVSTIRPAGTEATQAEAETFYISVTLYSDDGNPYELDRVPIAEKWVDGHGVTHYTLDGDRHILFPFYFEEAVSARVQVLVESDWRSGNHGSTWKFVSIILLAVDFGYCDDITGF